MKLMIIALPSMKPSTSSTLRHEGLESEEYLDRGIPCLEENVIFCFEYHQYFFFAFGPHIKGISLI